MRQLVSRVLGLILVAAIAVEGGLKW